MLLVLAMKPRRGPVCVNLPRNILAATNDYNINTNKPSFTNESTLEVKMKI
jgi:thiamine pyrophosphate-dependent acetolactate synthase large subunit-like protein